MPVLNTRNQATLVATQAAAIQSRSVGRLIDFTVGSILRAVIESNAGIALWLQALVIKVLAATRASTSTGTDLDTWVADYGLVRLGASPSVGTVTFARFTAGAQAVILVGARVKTTDATQEFQVVLDATNGAYNAGLGGYVLPINVASISLPVTAVVPSVASNVLANTVTLVTSSIPYIDTVNNAAAFTGGADQETDPVLRARFVLFIASLSKATKIAVGYAVASQRLGLEYTLTENYDPDTGLWRPGFFYVVIDNGSGAAPADLITQVQTAVEAVRAATVTFAVLAPTIVNVNVTLTVTVASGYTATVVKGEVGVALTNWIKAIPLGSGISFTKLAQIAYEASPGVTNVTGITLNGVTTDIAGLPRVSLQPLVITVN